MAAAAVIGAAVVAAGTETYISVDNAKHEETNASNASNVADDQTKAEIAAANQQQVNKENQQANITQVAQARVRAISNPDGDSIMTNPLGQVGTTRTNTGGTAAAGQVPSTPSPTSPGTSPGMVTTSGKTTIGG